MQSFQNRKCWRNLNFERKYLRIKFATLTFSTIIFRHNIFDTLIQFSKKSFHELNVKIYANKIIWIQIYRRNCLISFDFHYRNIFNQQTLSVIFYLRHRCLIERICVIKISLFLFSTLIH